MICRLCQHEDTEAREGQRCPSDGSLLIDGASLKTNPRDLLLGQTIGGEFGVVSIIGRGGFGTVYRAVQFPLLRPIALKVLHAQFYENDSVRQRFLQEARAMAALRSPSVVTLIRYGEQPPGTPLPGSQGFLFIAQEFIDGRTLREVIDADAPLPVARATTIAFQVLRGLAEAHRAGIVHRDLKPENIMVMREELGDENAKVLDFGIAKMLADDALPGGSPTTRSGMAMGTPDYMAPEQTDSKLVDHRADIYSLGIMLFEMLTGRKPYVADTHYMLITAHRIEPTPPLEGVDDAPDGLEALIHRALEKQAADRFASAREMADALRALPLPGVPFHSGSHPAMPIPPVTSTSTPISLSIADAADPAMAATIAKPMPKPGGATRFLALAAVAILAIIVVILQAREPEAVSVTDAAPATARSDAAAVGPVPNAAAQAPDAERPERAVAAPVDAGPRAPIPPKPASTAPTRKTERARPAGRRPKPPPRPRVNPAAPKKKATPDTPTSVTVPRL